MVTESIVLAGGLGTRLRGAVPDLPKAMAPVAGQPFLSYLLDFLELDGIRRVVLALGYRSEMIRGFFGVARGRLELVYSVEDEPLGTGGALARALPLLHGPAAFVVNGDTFLRLNYAGMASIWKRDEQVPLVVAVRPVSDAGRYGRAVVVDERIREFASHGTPGPGLVNAGIYLLAQDILNRYPMPEKFSWEKDFLEARVAEIRPLAFHCDVPFIDIGIPEALDRAQTLLPAWLN